MTSLNDTIAAIATPPGKGGVGIIRLSGPQSLVIAQRLTSEQSPQPRHAYFTDFKDVSGRILDQGLLLYFQQPHSYTGDDVVEIQGHGGPIVLDLLLKQTLQLGARLANPGEFTERAFHNGKLDLAQAEAVIDLIESGTEAAAKAASNSLQGHFSDAITALSNELVAIRVYIEAALDFSEEEIDFLADDAITQRIATIEQQLQELLNNAQQGQLLKDGMTVVIAGEPNVGKSSLLNQLSGRDSAIVTDIAGTTRDILREHINLDGLPLHIIDTAGLRESDDPVEKEGIKRAKKAIETADCLVVVDVAGRASTQSEPYLASLSNIPRLYVHNKVDLLGEEPSVEQREGIAHIYLSAKQRLGINLLTSYLKELIGFKQVSEGTFIARRRHLHALQQAQQAVITAQENLKFAHLPELAAEELKLAHQSLCEITGEFSSDDLLGEIFSNFCIGK